MFLDRYFEGFIYGKIGGLVTGFQDGNNSVIWCFVADKLGAGVGRDIDRMTLGIYKVT